MEISEREYWELKRRLDLLESRQKVASMDRGWAFMVNELPYDIIRAVSGTNAELKCYCGRSASDAWKAFTDLAKHIHRKPTSFVWEYSSYHRSFVWHQELYRTPSRYSQLTDEQKLLSLDMLNELIPIFNKYYMLANPYAIAIKGGEKLEVQVDYDRDECKF